MGDVSFDMLISIVCGRSGRPELPKNWEPIRAKNTLARAKSVLSPFQMNNFAFAYAHA